MEKKQQLAGSAAKSSWTRPDAYIGALARKRSFRRRNADLPRTQPERPRLLLSTVPFMALIGLLAVLAVLITIAAFPGAQPQHKPRQFPQKEQGVAERGWFEEAQKEMHR